MVFFARYSNSLLLNKNYSHSPVVVPSGSEIFTNTQVTHFFVVPSGVTELFAVAVGGGGMGGAGSSVNGGGGGGGLRYINNLPVTPGETLRINVGRGSYVSGGAGARSIVQSQPSRISREDVTLMFAQGGGGAGTDSTTDPGGVGGGGTTIGAGPFGGTIGGGNGGAGGTGNSLNAGGGGGAGGYSGNGGTGGGINGSNVITAPTAGTGGGGGGGSYNSFIGAGGGGVGIYGEGSNGSAGSPGTGGSGGGDGIAGYVSGAVLSNQGAGGLYGGGGGDVDNNIETYPTQGLGANGVVRILWGSGIAFPSTNVSA